MGSQQLVMVILSVVIVGVAIFGGFTLFQLRLQKSSRDAIIHDMNEIAVRAVGFKKMPALMGGGAGSWDLTRFYQLIGLPLSEDESYILTENGRISITDNGDGSIDVVGLGTEIGDDGVNVVSASLRVNTNNEMELSIVN